MSDSDNANKRPLAGTVGWIDMTTENAGQIREFYESVVGWSSEAVPVDDYQDYVISPAAGGDPVAGICHQKGSNANVPGGWMIYIHVDDLEASLSSCLILGGDKVGEIRDMGSYGKTCVIRDPSGAVSVLIESP